MKVAPANETRRPTVARKGRVRASAAAAAAVLALGVLGLFLRLQEYGPESALRKFHQAIERRSLPDLQRVTIEDVRSPEVQNLVARVGAYMAVGGNRFRILRTDRTPNEVRAAVAYPLPNGATPFVVWIVERQGRTWRVSADATSRVMQDAFGL